MVDRAALQAQLEALRAENAQLKAEGEAAQAWLAPKETREVPAAASARLAELRGRFRPTDRTPMSKAEADRFSQERQVLALRSEQGNLEQRRRVRKGFGWQESAGRWEAVED